MTTSLTVAPAPVRDKLLLTLREAAQMMSMSERGLWNLLKPRGPIPAIKIGSRGIRIAVADLEAYIESQREAVTNA